MNNPEYTKPLASDATRELDALADAIQARLERLERAIAALATRPTRPSPSARVDGLTLN